MRNLYLFYLIICVVSCKAKSELASGLAKEVTPVICPENGNCSFEILKNKDLLVQTDHLGSVYTQVVEGVGAVLKFEYKKQEKAGYEDSGYREEIFIALNLDELNIETEKLNEEKLFFARCTKQKSLKTRRNLNTLPDKQTVVTIGTFDGVHIGHQKIINRLINTGKELTLQSVILTFFPHPRMVLQKDSNIKLINTIDERHDILEASGLDSLVIKKQQMPI